MRFKEYNPRVPNTILEVLTMRKCTRKQRKLLADIEYTLILLEKSEENHFPEEAIKKLASHILYRIHIQGLTVGEKTYVRKTNIINNGNIWNLENVRVFLASFK